MTQDLVRQAIEGAVKVWADDQDLPMAWPNVIFPPARQPVPDGIYGRLSILRAPTLSLDLKGAHRGFVGVFQISLYQESDKGDGEVTRLADTLDEAFPVNRRITVNGLTVQIISVPYVAPAVEGADRDFIPVSINYRADISTDD